MAPAARSRKPIDAPPPAAFSWFPGHMRTAWRRLEQDLRQVDVVVCLLDARIPVTSRNLALERSLKDRNQSWIFVLNKADLAETRETELWAKQLASTGWPVVCLTSRGGKGLGPLRPHLDKVRAEIEARRNKRTLLERPLRVQVVGLPNVGKSTLLNRLVERSAAKTGKKPGLTRGQAQWINGPEGIQLMDCPGIMAPRIDTWDQVALLAACGNIKSDILPLVDVAGLLLQQLVRLGITSRLPVDTDDLETLGRKLGYLLPGAEIDLERTARWLLAQCFDGKLGRITWERVQDGQQR
jgi:ribosome biogenesis GTPase A